MKTLHKTGFHSFNLKPFLAKALEKTGFTELTPIQKEAIPVALQGEDLIGQAQTGTGKTLAFGIPIAELVLPVHGVQALVLTPTRELALQVAGELQKLCVGGGLRVASVYGGASMERQTAELREGSQIVVGTPGRVLDHLEHRTLNLSRVKILVLDEADRMLDMGFIDDVKEIISHTSRERQTMLFSATMPGQIISLAREDMRSPIVLKVSEDELTVKGIKQFYASVDTRRKASALTFLLKEKKPRLAIVFTRTKRGADNLSYLLKKMGFRAEATHGNLTQSQRERVLQAFKREHINILVATDVAARGLDIPEVTHIFNYNLPTEPMGYVHRIGRTGRAGATGEAISFITNLAEQRELETIGRLTNSKIEKIEIPEHSLPKLTEPPREYGENRGGFRPRQQSRGGSFHRGPPRSGGFRGRSGPSQHHGGSSGGGRRYAKFG